MVPADVRLFARGLCRVRSSNCHVITVTGNGFIRSDRLSCRLQQVAVSNRKYNFISLDNFNLICFCFFYFKRPVGDQLSCEVLDRCSLNFDYLLTSGCRKLLWQPILESNSKNLFTPCTFIYSIFCSKANWQIATKLRENPMTVISLYCLEI